MMRERPPRCLLSNPTPPLPGEAMPFFFFLFYFRRHFVQPSPGPAIPSPLQLFSAFFGPTPATLPFLFRTLYLLQARSEADVIGWALP